MIAGLPVELLIAINAEGWPPEADLQRLAAGAVAATGEELHLDWSPGTQLSLYFSSDEEISRMNGQWRGFSKPTNVLSFPAVVPDGFEGLPPVLGDIAFALNTVSREAELENKTFDHHLSHLLVHGLLHLLGYDHETDDDAIRMETLETQILARLAIPDPYGMMDQDD